MNVPSPVERFTTRSGIRIRYLDNAPDQAIGLPILFSPGFTDFADEYLEVLAALAPQRVLVVEVRGRGGSETPSHGYAAADHAADLRAVLDEEDIERFHLMTFSRGTTWALDLLLADADRVATLAVGDYWAREKALGAAMAEQVLQGTFRGTPMAQRVLPHVIREVFASSVERDLFAAVAATRVPVLVATGTEPGCLLDDAAVLEWRDRVPGVEVVTIDGASHDLFRPDRLAFPLAARDLMRRHSP